MDNLVQAVDRFVVYSRHDGSKLNSNGVAIDAPENTDAEWTGRKINRTWTDFQAAYKELKDSDTSAPVAQDTDTGADSDTFQFESEDLTEQLAGIQGTSATFVDDNLALVTTIYGFQEEVPPFEGGGPDETYFMAVAELEAFSTENPGEYFTPQWDKWWFTVEYDPGKLTEWIPMAFATSYVFDGQGYWEYSAEIDYYEAGKDYSGYEFPADFATLTIMVDEDWEVVDHSIQTYKVLFSGPDDEEGTVLIDKTTKWFKPGDRVQFWNFGFNLNDETKDDWFESSDVITFTQEPRFLLELLEFEDEAGELIEYQYAMWAEDISGNGVLTELAFAEPEKGKRIRSRSGTDDVQRLLREGSCPQCDLRGAILMGIDLRDANLRGADLRGANLTTTILFRANLSGANLTSAGLSGANLNSINLSGANLTSTNLTSTNLSGANLSGLDLGGANLTGANLRGAGLTSTNLVGTDLSDANLHGVDLRGFDLRGANLRGANLRGADVGNVDLEVANLSGADLRGTDLGNVNLRLSDLRGANMFGVNLRGADLSGARFDATTKACDSKFLSRLLKIQFGIC